MAYYSSLELRYFANDQSRIWQIALTGYVVMSGAIFVLNAKDYVYLE